MARYEGDPLDFPFVPWDELMGKIRWAQGDHQIVIGETGAGKTTLISKLVQKPRLSGEPRHTVTMVSKTFDDSFSRKRWPGFVVMREWHKRKAANAGSVLLWPEARDTIELTVAEQRRVFDKALNEIFRERGWTVVVDELHWFITQLKFKLEMETYQHQARSSGITMVTGFQRPANVPVVTYGSAMHAWVSRQTEGDDVKRLAALAGVDANQLAAALPLLEKHDWLYLGRDSKDGVVRTRVDLNWRHPLTT